MKLGDDFVEKILRRISSNGFDARRDIDPDLFDITFKWLNEAVEKGFGSVEYGTDDAYFVHQIKYNNAVFAAFKAHREQNELRAAMFDEDGKVRSFAQFRKAAEPIVAGYNERWLQTEYDTAIIRAGHAAQWRNREHERTLYPNLEWLASTSATPREGHKPFYGLVLPEVDPFWQSNYPGSLWGCKCGIRSTAAPVTPKKQRSIALRSAPRPVPGLDENPALSQAIFSISHPYYRHGAVPYRKLAPIIGKYARNTMQRYTLQLTGEVRTAIDPYRGRTVVSHNLATGSAVFLRRTFKDVKTHNPDTRALLHISNPDKAVTTWEYIGWKEVDVYPKGHKLAGQRKHPDAEYFTYYKTEIGGRTHYVHVKYSKKTQTEIPYAITDSLNMKGINKNKPR